MVVMSTALSRSGPLIRRFSAGCGGKLGAHVPELLHRHADMGDFNSLKFNFTAGDRGGAQKCARDDTVGNGTPCHRAELLHSLDVYGGSSLAGDLRAHRVQEVAQVRDFRLAGGVFDDGLPFRHRSGHHEVLGARMRGVVQADDRSGKPRGRRAKQSFLVDHPRPHFAEAIEVEIHRPRSNGAPARQRYAELPEPSQKRSGEQKRGPHLLHQIVGRDTVVHAAGVDGERPVLGIVTRLAAQFRDELLEHLDIVKMGNVREDGDALLGHERRAHHGENRVLHPLDGNFSPERTPPLNNEFIH